MNTKRECEFIGAAATKDFLFEKIDIAADRGYGVIVEPVGGENDRVFNIYQVTPSMALSAPKLSEALRGMMIGQEIENGRVVTLTCPPRWAILASQQALAEVEVE